MGWAASEENSYAWIPHFYFQPNNKKVNTPPTSPTSHSILHSSLNSLSNVTPHLKRMTSATARRTARSRVKSSLTDDDDHLNSGSSKSTPKFRKHQARNNSINNLNINLKLLLGFGVFAFSIALFFIYSLVNFTGEVDDKILRIVTPFPSPKLTDLPMVLSRISFHIRLVNAMYMCDDLIGLLLIVWL